MLVALTVRRLKRGSFDGFRDAFMEGVTDLPDGWVRFHMVRGEDDPDQVVCFGFFDGTVEDLRELDRTDYDRQQKAIAPFVESVGTDGFFDVVETWTA